MEIRIVTVEELPKLSGCAAGFYSASQSLGEFDLDCFVCFWKGLIEAGAGVIFGLFDGEEVRGVLGGVAGYEPNAPVKTASELFWWVDPEARGLGSMRLYYEFEKWAKVKGCKTIRMVRLSDSMPEEVEGIYARLGFAEIERHYSKTL